MNSGGDERFVARYVRAWEALTLIAILAAAVALIVSGLVLHPSSKWSGGLIAVGESIIASLIVYVLISVFLSPRQQMAQTRQISSYAIVEANRQFQATFAVSLPTAVHESSSFLKPSFRSAFEKMLTSSTRYDYKGDSAKFTTFRLAVGSKWPAMRRLDQIRLCILDPEAESPMRACAERQLRERRELVGQQSLETEARRTQDDIYVSLVTLFDIREALATCVYFHRDLPIYRCEVFDDGMFLTYYMGNVPYPEALEYAKSTRPYQAYKAGMEMARRFSERVLLFGDFGSSADLVDTDEKFTELLAKLGCQHSMEKLRTMREERFSLYKTRLNNAGFETNEIF